MLKDILENKKCFKLICGAGNEDITEVEKLVTLYSLAGCQMFDICAKEEVVDAAQKGLERAGIKDDRYICISVGSESDQHFCKAQIDYQKCIQCHKCEEICIQNAINYGKINQTRCIGCKKCVEVCPHNCIKLVQKKTNLKELLPKLIEKGLDCIELHVVGEDEQDVDNRWKDLNEMYTGPLCISIDRSKVGDEKILARVERMIKNRKPYTTIVQADGIPMSGGKDDYKSTLQSIAIAELFQNESLPVYIMSSGGTNSKTTTLAKMFDLKINRIN